MRDLGHPGLWRLRECWFRLRWLLVGESGSRVARIPTAPLPFRVASAIGHPGLRPIESWGTQG